MTRLPLGFLFAAALTLSVPALAGTAPPDLGLLGVSYVAIPTGPQSDPWSSYKLVLKRPLSDQTGVCAIPGAAIAYDCDGD